MLKPEVPLSGEKLRAVAHREGLEPDTEIHRNAVAVMGRRVTIAVCPEPVAGGYRSASWSSAGTVPLTRTPGCLAIRRSNRMRDCPYHHFGKSENRARFEWSPGALRIWEDLGQPVHLGLRDRGLSAEYTGDHPDLRAERSPGAASGA